MKLNIWLTYFAIDLFENTNHYFALENGRIPNDHFIAKQIKNDEINRSKKLQNSIFSKTKKLS